GHEPASDTLGYAALLLAEQQEDDRIEKEGDGGREQHGALLAQAAPDDRPKQEFLDQRTDRCQRDARREQGEHEGQAELAIDPIGNETAQHIHLSMGEIQHVHQGADEREAKRNQSILRAKIEPVGDDLFHKARLTGFEDASQARSAQSTSPTNNVLNLPSLYSLTTMGTKTWRFWPKEVVPTYFSLLSPFT